MANKLSKNVDCVNVNRDRSHDLKRENVTIEFPAASDGDLRTFTMR